MYRFPRLDVIGKRPVWSEKVLPVMGIIFVDIGVIVGVDTGDVWLCGVVCCVDCIFLNCWCRCPLIVEVDFGRYLVISSGVNPGHVEKKTSLIALMNVEGTGLKHDFW